MGFKNIIGCDKSEKAVSDTRKNIEWMKVYGQLSKVRCQVSQCDVQKLSQRIKTHSIDAIVTEPYLGPSRGKRDRKAIEKIACELEQLYHQAILQFEKVLKPNGRVVMIWPVFVLAKNESIFLNTKNILKNTSFQKIIPLAGFPRRGLIEISERNTMFYYRESQKVRREIVILQKSSLYDTEYDTEKIRNKPRR